MKMQIGKHIQKKDAAAKIREKKWMVAGAALLLLILVLVVVYHILFVRPELPGGVSTDGTEQIDVGDGLQPVISGDRKSENYYTFLLLGRDTGGGGNCDTMIVVSYDMTNQKATLMSIPRDTMVNVPWDVKKINSVYPHYGANEAAIEQLKKEVSQLVGFAPDYTVVVEWEAIGELVDAIGGVWFDVPYDMSYHDPYQDLVIEQAKGYRRLSGDDAMQVIRWRKNDHGGGYREGDLGRIKTQQDFLKSVIGQVLQVKNAFKLYEFSQIFKRNVTTELSIQNLFWLGKGAALGGLSINDVNFVTMPGHAVSVWSRLVKNMQSYVVPHSSELLRIVNEDLSPFTKTFSLGDLDIMFVNADGSIGSTAGYVEDAPAALAPVIPNDTEEGEDTETPDGDGEETDMEIPEAPLTEEPVDEGAVYEDWMDDYEDIIW